MSSLFPSTPEEAKVWEPIVRRVALHRNILVVARTRIEGAWACYIGPVPGQNHDNEMAEVFDHGNKLPEPMARYLFPSFKDIPYAE